METAKHRFTSVIGGNTRRQNLRSVYRKRAGRKPECCFQPCPNFPEICIFHWYTPHCSATSPFQIGPSNIQSFSSSSISSKSESGTANVNMFAGMVFPTFALAARSVYPSTARGRFFLPHRTRMPLSVDRPPSAELSLNLYLRGWLQPT